MSFREYNESLIGTVEVLDLADAAHLGKFEYLKVFTNEVGLSESRFYFSHGYVGVVQKTTYVVVVQPQNSSSINSNE